MAGWAERQANHRLEQMVAENTGLQAQLLTQAREAGAGDERQRMAREIHDTIAQGLTGIVTQLEAAQQTGDDAPRRWRPGSGAACCLVADTPAAYLGGTTWGEGHSGAVSHSGAAS